MLPEAEFSEFWSTIFPLLGALIIIIFKVFPPSVLLAKKTFQCLVSLFGHTVYTLARRGYWASRPVPVGLDFPRRAKKALAGCTHCTSILAATITMLMVDSSIIIR
ncbi:MAG TPA: hypothetical protein VK553_07920 [Candidatus Nitrosopolaris rasttigaisensis]|nr:hypothetical protein [Candidatus Nitrosopolaris rasttigaisensis]